MEDTTRGERAAMFGRRARRQAERIDELVLVNLQQAQQITTLLDTNQQQAVRIEELSRQLAEARSKSDSRTEPGPSPDKRGRIRRWFASWRRSKLTPAEFAAEP